jgi:hypothetical protein
MWGLRFVCQCLDSYNVLMWQWNSRGSKGLPSIVVILGFLQFKTSQYLSKFFYLTPKGPRVFWCKTTQNYPLLKKEPVILF